MILSNGEPLHGTAGMSRSTSSRVLTGLPSPRSATLSVCARRAIREPVGFAPVMPSPRVWDEVAFHVYGHPVLSGPNRGDFELQIASDCNRNSRKITATPKTSVKLRFHCDFCGKNLRLRNCDWQSLAICDCDCVGH